jgi:hypothetical protein
MTVLKKMLATIIFTVEWQNGQVCMLLLERQIGLMVSKKINFSQYKENLCKKF